LSVKRYLFDYNESAGHAKIPSAVELGLIVLGVIIITIRNRSGKVTGKLVLPEGSTATVEQSPRGTGTAQEEPPWPPESEPAGDARTKTAAAPPEGVRPAETVSTPETVGVEGDRVIVENHGLTPEDQLPRADVALETLTPVKATTGWGQVHINKTAGGWPIGLAGKKYTRGVGVHANSELVFDLRPDYERFVGRVGIDDRMKGEGNSISVKVFADGRLLGESPLLKEGHPPWCLNVELPKDSKGQATGQLRLVVDATEDGIDCDVTDWVDAGFIVNPRLVQATGGTGGLSTATTAPRPQAPVGEPSVPATVLSGSWRVDRQELVQASRDEEAMSTMLFGDPDWTDYDFTFEMKSDQGTGAANVFYRGSQQGKRALVFVIPSKPDPCWVEVWPADGGGEHEGPARFRFVRGTWIPVRVRVRGNQSVCSVFENGREVVALRVGTGKHSKGQVGLSTFGSSYRFRNIQVTTPDNKTLWKGVPDRIMDAEAKILWEAPAARTGAARGSAAGAVERPALTPLVKPPVPPAAEKTSKERVTEKTPPTSKDPMEEVVRVPIEPWSYALAFSSDNDRVAVDNGWNIKLIDLKTGKVLRDIEPGRPVFGKFATLSSMAFAPDGRIVSSHVDQMIRIWDSTGSRKIREFGDGPLGDWFWNLRYSDKGKWVVGRSQSQREIRIWKLETGEQIQRYEPESPVSSLDLHPDGHLIVSIHNDHVIRIWDALSGKPVEVFPDISKKIARVSFSPGGRLVLCLPHGEPVFSVLDRGIGQFQPFEGPSRAKVPGTVDSPGPSNGSSRAKVPGTVDSPGKCQSCCHPGGEVSR
jgi:hypothetical protein